ncbi:MAG TPA: AMIN domain-containing protein [Longimicrobium sp.]|nr:AMIN domain-containing protein [Longimicrobium sp.]
MNVRSAALALLLPALLGAGNAPAETSGSVAALRLEARGGRTELTVEIAGGQARWTDFALDGPPRVVVDIEDATLDLPARRYEGLNRGGVLGVRTSQHAPDVVRVVLDLERGTEYRVERVDGGLRVTLSSGAAAFQAWSSGPAAPRPAAGRPRTTPAPITPVAQQAQGRPITVSFENTAMRDVLATFAEFSGRSIIAGEEVAEITVDGVAFNRQPWDVALRTLLGAYGLAAEELPGGIIRVDRMEKLASRAATEPLVTTPFRINYVPAAELSETFKELLSERGSIVANQATNTLIVTDVDRVVGDVRRLITELDVPVAQVAIEGKIIFVDRTQLEALGIRYDIKDFQGNSFGSVVESPVYDPDTGLPTGASTPEDVFLLGGPSIGAVGNGASEIDDATLDVAISLLLANRFSLVALVQALQTSRVADVQAMPQITTLDNKEARIFVGEEITFLTASASGGQGGAVTLQPVQVEAGILMEVTPHVTADGRVRLTLRAENSNPTTTSNNLLNVSRQEAENEVLVADGETVVIGGLTVTRVTDTRSGIPFLMDLPLIGGLFRTTNREERKQDLLILITPHIVRDAA